MDVDNIRQSWASITPAVLAVHESLVVAALIAVDSMMLEKSIAAGFVYDVTWESDRPERATQTYWGAPSAQALNVVPLLVLRRIKDGMDPDEVMTLGFNYLHGIFTTEAHEIARNVPLDRLLA